MMRWIEAVAVALVGRESSRQNLMAATGAGGACLRLPPLRAGCPEGRSAIRAALEAAWLGVEAVLACPVLLQREPPAVGLAHVFLRGAAWVRGDWASAACFREEMRAGWEAVTEARRAGALAPADEADDRPLLLDWASAARNGSHGEAEELKLALRGLTQEYPGLRVVAKLRWLERPLLLVFAEELLRRGLPGGAGGWAAVREGRPAAEAALCDVIDALANSTDEVRFLLDAWAEGTPGPEMAPPASPADRLDLRAGPAVRCAARVQGLTGEELEEAARECDRAVEADPADTAALELRADVLALRGRDEEAVADYSRVCALAPASPEALRKRADIHFSRGRFERAAADYTEALYHRPDSAELLARRSAAFRRLGRLDEALRDTSEARALDPDSARAHLEHGTLLRERRDAPGAVRALDLAVALDPAEPEAYFERACARLACGDARGAEADFTAALGLSPRHAPALLGRGRLRAERGDLVGGAADLTAAAEAGDDPTPALLERAPLFARLGRLDQALEDCDAILERQPERGEVWVARGEYAAAQGALDEAEASFTRALEISADLGRAYEGRGACAARRGRRAEALRDLAEAIRLDPANARALHLRGTLNAQEGRPLEALADFHQAALLDPELLPAYYGQRARLHLARGEYALALGDAVIELRLDPCSPGAMQRQEEARKGLGQQEEARRALEGEERPAPPTHRRPRLRRPAHPGGDGRHRAPRTAVALPEALPPGEGEAPAADPRPLPPPLTPEFPGEQELPAPSLSGATAPDQAVPAPETVENGEQAVGPVEARALRAARWAKIEEQARRWDAVHGPRPAEPAAAVPHPKRPAPEEDEAGERPGWLKCTAAVLLLLAVLGGGVYGLIWLGGDPHVNAAGVYQEFFRDAEGASARYRGRFVQVTGPARVYSHRSGVRVYLQPPEDKPAWWIEVPLSPTEASRVPDKTTITVRGRFATTRKPTGGLLMSNCQLLKTNSHR